MDDAEVRDVVGQAALGGQGGMRLSRVAIHADVLQTRIERTVYAFSLEIAKKRSISDFCLGQKNERDCLFLPFLMAGGPLQP